MKTIKERFEEKIFYSPDGCWYWTATGDTKGYGRFYLNKNNRSEKAPRASYKIFKGDIGSLHVLHTCDNPYCVNPDHLYLGTNRDNINDKVKRGRSPKGSKNPKAKFNEAKIHEIRALKGTESQRLIAIKYGVSRSCIQSILSGPNWKHV